MAALDIIKIKDLTKRFDDFTVLDHVSLNVKEGENLVVFGRSGTGKSVLLKCIIGLLEPDEGEIFIKNKNILKLNVNELNKIRRHTSFLFQGAALYDSMSVRENLEFTLIKRKKNTHEEIDEKVHRTLNLVGLEDAIDKMPSELSGGMKKRIGLARAIITEPDIMFYDEPTTGLDPISSKDISELIISLQKDLNMTSIVVTHDLVCAKIIADRAIFLKDGKIAYEGTLDELVHSRDKFLQNFFSTDLIKS